MSKTRETLRLRWTLDRSVREVARALNLSAGVVAKTEKRARLAGVDAASLETIDDDELERRLYGGPKHSRGPPRPTPDPIWMHAELRRPGVTLELLHLEYLREHPAGYRYTAFADVYRRWLARRGVVMRQQHEAGERAVVDYSGKRPRVVDRTTGEVIDVELFVAVLGASNLTHAEATWSQKIADFVGSHVRAFECFGGVPKITVPDQLRSAVRVPSRYEPTIARTYAALGRHYGTAIVPARPRKPRDKAKVEVGVQIAQRWILARLRNETFVERAERSNSRAAERAQRAGDEEAWWRESPRALRPRRARRAASAAKERFELSEWKGATVNGDYHVQLANHLYSVPYTLVREEIEARLTVSTVEIFFKGQRVASHPRSIEQFRFTTDPTHMPEAHRQHFAGATSVLAWAATVGPMTEALANRIFDASPVREQGWRSAKGLQRLAKRYGDQRLETACAHALHFGARSFKPVERLLALGREKLTSTDTTTPRVAHENVRGPGYFH